MAALKVPVSFDDHIQGKQDAPLTLVEYGDYQCPHCAAAFVIVKELQNHFRNRLRFVFRNFPLTEIHDNAQIAAVAAEYAADHNRFWEMHDKIYEDQENLSIQMLIDLATELGLTPKGLEKAIREGIYDAKIEKDFMGGVKSGVNGTPTFFINDQRYNGMPVLEDMTEALDEVLRVGAGAKKN